MLTYESKLNGDLAWALQEGGMFFNRESSVHTTLLKITQKLDELHIDYALVGGMALFFHGFRRFTEDVDLLVTKEGLARIHEQLEGRGFVAPFEGSRNLRDTDTGVKVEFLVTGQFPGDGKPKAVAFPKPEDVTIMIEGIRCVQLNKLIELKLASGTTGGRLKDLADVQELIRLLHLPEAFAGKLNESVREEFTTIWKQTSQQTEQEQ